MCIRDRKKGGPDDHVFRPTLGAEAPLWHHKRIAHAFAVARDLAGLRKELTPHALRRTAATWLFQSGQPVQYAQKLLGHASIVTTEKHYASLETTDVGPSLDIVGRIASQTSQTQHEEEGEKRWHDVATPENEEAPGVGAKVLNPDELGIAPAAIRTRDLQIRSLTLYPG